MLKMFSTQLTGLFNRIVEKDELLIEDSARLLAQAVVGDGSIYIYGTKEMKTVIFEALESQEPLTRAVKYEKNQLSDKISNTDRFLIISRYSTDAEAVDLGKDLAKKGIPFAAISTEQSTEDESLSSLADIHIDLRLTKGLLPDESGNRFGYPASIAALFLYYGIKFAIEEIISEYE